MKGFAVGATCHQPKFEIWTANDGNCLLKSQSQSQCRIAHTTRVT